LEEQTFLEQFDTIEERVGQVLQICRSLQTENTELKTKVDAIEREIEARVEAESRYQAERNLVRSKIDGLLAKIEDFAVRPR